MKQTMIDLATERVTGTSVAISAVASPYWLPSLSDVSSFAALILPILGVSWLVIQIVGYALGYEKKKK